MGLSDGRGDRLFRSAADDFIGTYFFPRLETNRLAWRNGNLFSGSRISSHATLSRFDDENSETPQLYSFTTFQRIFKRIEYRLHRNFRFYLGDIQLLCNTVYDVLLYHAGPPLS
jgi:hypothetical protein